MKLQRIIRAMGMCLIMIAVIMAASFVTTRVVSAAEAASSTTAQAATGNAYGYGGTFDSAKANEAFLQVALGSQVLDEIELIHVDTPAVQVLNRASLIVRNSYVCTETSLKTTPALDVFPELIIGGRTFTVLDQENSQSYYLNSTLAAQDLGALCINEGLPASENAKEQSVYTYGSKLITTDGGCGACVDFLGNLSIYGSAVQGAEIGIISDTFGELILGNIEDGENNADLAGVLSVADKSKRLDKQLDSVVKGGRNALMVICSNRNLTPETKEYLESIYGTQELALLSASIVAHDTVLKTDLSLDKGVKYPEQTQAYLDHTKGSVIVISSTNADITLDNCELIADEKGTGYLIQTIIAGNTAAMIMGEKAETYDGISVVMKDMEVTGDIAHEDYHRDFSLVLDSTKFNGAMNQYGVDQWIEAGEQEGFADYCPDKTFDIQHGLTVSLKGESTWIVTADSYLYGLELEPGSVVKGVIYVDGVMQNGKEGSYKGNVVVKPLSGRSQHEMTAHGFVPKTEASTTPATSSTPTPTPTPAEHTTHNWVASETVAATCTTEGYILYTCTGCSETYKDILPATEHAYMATVTVAPTCDTDGYTVYECTKCKDVITVPIPATGHNYIAVAYVAPTCETDGYTYYECSICKSGYADPVPATGHDWHEMGGSPPTCTLDETTNWECSICGLDYKEVHPGTALGHNYQWQYTASPTCVDYGYECYFCSRCGEEYHENFKPPYGTEGDIGHDYVLTGKYDTFFHYYACKLCGKEYAEPHKGDPCSVCGKSGA